MTGLKIPDLSGVMEKFLNPTCPTFPKISVALGRAAVAVTSFIEWFGLPVGPLGVLLQVLSLRRHLVRWALLSPEDRMKTLIIGGGLVGIMGLMSFGCGSTRRAGGLVR